MTALTSLIICGDTQKTVKVGDIFTFTYTDCSGLAGLIYETSFTITPSQEKNCIEFVHTHYCPSPQNYCDYPTYKIWYFKALCPGKQTITFTRKINEAPIAAEIESHEITVVKE